jgi:hypothetical protein
MPSLLARLTRRRVRAIDAARVALFDLAVDEEAIEAWQGEMTSVWPGSLAGMMSPSFWEKIPLDEQYLLTAHSSDPKYRMFTQRRFPVWSVLLLTDRRLTWCPFRTYRGGLVYASGIDSILAGGVKPESSNAIYTRFPGPSLAARSVSISTIDHADLIVFAPGDLALLNIYLNDGPQPNLREPVWPVYDMRFGNNLTDDVEAVWEGPSAPTDQTFLQFAALGAASMNAGSLAAAMKYANVPFRGDFIEGDMGLAWSEILSARRTEWRSLSQRLS